MARPKAFDHDQVIEKAMDAFWSYGYEPTSVQDLVKLTGINRGSLYDTFGSKHELFMEALERYEKQRFARLITRLERPGPVREAITRLFGEVLEGAVSCTQRRGCLLTNAAVELAPHDPLVADRLKRTFGQLEEAFYRALLRAQQTGEVSSERDPRALARFLTSSLQGLQVTAKSSPDRVVLEDVVKVTLQVLN
jgi:TetR/AcrR family transcriptional regulator, transcriptional repressor for nem operon